MSRSSPGGGGGVQVNLIRVLDGRGDSAVPIFAKFETAREGAHVPAEQHIQVMSGVRTLPAAGVRSGCWIDRCSPKHKGCECCNVENWACGACNAKCGWVRPVPLCRANDRLDPQK